MVFAKEMYNKYKYIKNQELNNVEGREEKNPTCFM